MFKERITDIFFDLDHTLWDFDKNSYLTFEKILKKNDVNVNLDSFIRQYAPINLEFWKLYRENKIAKADLRFLRLKRTFEALGMEVSEEVINILSTQYIDELAGFNHLILNTKSILDYLNPKYNLHIITNGFEEVQHKKLSTSGIAEYFDLVVNSEMAGVKKPHPYIFELALDRAGTTARSSVMIGDSLEADILGANALGLHTLHFDPYGREAHKHCTIIRDLIEIKSYL